MKLDKIAFARVIQYVGELVQSGTFYHNAITDLDNLIEIDVPATEVQVVRPNVADIHAMLDSIKNRRKIDAIKCHRSITGYGLKDAKEVIESYWPEQGASEVLDRMTAKISEMQRAQASEDRGYGEKSYILENFNYEQLEVIKNFVESFRNLP